MSRPERNSDELLGAMLDGDRVALARLITRIEGLKIGGTPPDFEGQTVDGKKIALSDYRGKVTFLVFWGFW